MKSEGQYHVVRAACDTELQQYRGSDTARLSRVTAARPKAVFVNTYISIGDITSKATILDGNEVALPTIEDSPPSRK